ncbi:S4 domain-containing protein [Parasphingorhabdus sp.]|uniref:RNA-binding S4 domain-containing protein n=1 Tax=Parasphingorhabdus sp. TaxID=2709688 RepID=UPI003263C90C
MKAKPKTSSFKGPKSDSHVIRIDKLLWFLRFVRNRSMAKKMSTKGHLRLNGRRVQRAHTSVRAGDILTVPRGREVHVIRISRLPERRGAPAFAHSCFEKLEAGQ